MHYFFLPQRIFTVVRTHFATKNLLYQQRTYALDLHAFDPCWLGQGQENGLLQQDST